MFGFAIVSLPCSRTSLLTFSDVSHLPSLVCISALGRLVLCAMDICDDKSVSHRESFQHLINLIMLLP